MVNYNERLLENKEAYVADLIELLSLPSISTDASHANDVRKTADWVEKRLRRAGIEEVRLMETGGHPVVYGERIESPEVPTVLFYGHFDVQPAEPIELWEHDPFVPYIDNGLLYARGASDMKANLLLPVIACEALLQSEGQLPVNVKFLFEGEEEIGSPSLGSFIEKNQQLLACDLVISADGGIGSANQPVVNIGNRGLAGLQLRVKSADVDLHSGMGGYAPNALHGLVTILDRLRDEEGRILVDGFYEDVTEISELEKGILAEGSKSLDEQMKQTGMKSSFGEPEFSPMERMLVRPTLEINGLWGGFQGQGIKTVIPHEAFAKITCRLVGKQNPAKIRDLLKTYIQKIAPSYLDIEFEDLPGEAFSYRLAPDHPSVKALQKMLALTTDTPVSFGFSGGTVPVMGLLKHNLGVDTITVGASEAGQNAHAPNEWVSLENYYRLQGIYCEFLNELSTLHLRSTL
ncbi:dipeptidase [Pullulanibacillus sp. KACC 23026]|uniref:dipeptidase n=1 Tax=Pullulanibacillus sp. KACC 23026 TaxID=3028315 RepID=UPI0023AF9C38|nr:dipeptidase [Pullulanibacillus sp. KACC 23026]WEG14818.1 dipeptidase [Pullulanibacillus sp. KACC 23026]